MSIPPTELTRWELAQLLAEPTRREVFECVRRARAALSRDEVAEATGINRRLATFHLDRLSEAGLLVTHYARPEGKKGPGAGRPAKRYAVADVELDLSLPARQYEFAARLLAQAIEAAPGDAVASSLATARQEGRRLGELRRTTGRGSKRDRSEDLVESLVALGYEPTAGSQPVRFHNCPFRSAARVAPDLICGMNCELVAGLLEGLGMDPVAAALEPAPPDCCVTVTLPA